MMRQKTNLKPVSSKYYVEELTLSWLSLIPFGGPVVPDYTICMEGKVHREVREGRKWGGRE